MPSVLEASVCWNGGGTGFCLLVCDCGVGTLIRPLFYPSCGCRRCGNVKGRIRHPAQSNVRSVWKMIKGVSIWKGSATVTQVAHSCATSFKAKTKYVTVSSLQYSLHQQHPFEMFKAGGYLWYFLWFSSCQWRNLNCFVAMRVFWDAVELICKWVGIWPGKNLSIGIQKLKCFQG